MNQEKSLHADECLRINPHDYKGCKNISRQGKSPHSEQEAALKRAHRSGNEMFSSNMQIKFS